MCSQVALKPKSLAGGTKGKGGWERVKGGPSELHLISSRIPSLHSRWQEERSDAHRLSSDHGTPPCNTHTHTQCLGRHCVPVSGCWWCWWRVQKTEKLTLVIFPTGYLLLTSNSKGNQMGSKEKVVTRGPSSPCRDLAPLAVPTP